MSSSSASIIGSDVATPCPISLELSTTVVLPSGCIFTQTSGEKSAAGAVSPTPGANARPNDRPAPPTATMRRKSLRSSAVVMLLPPPVRRLCVQGVVQRQRAQALAGEREDRVGDRRGDARYADLARPGGFLRAAHD